MFRVSGFFLFPTHCGGKEAYEQFHVMGGR